MYNQKKDKINNTLKIIQIRLYSQFNKVYKKFIVGLIQEMMYSEIIQRTPSVYFKFDDQNNANFTKSSIPLDYSISNQKHILSNNRFNKFKNNQHSNQHQLSHKNSAQNNYQLSKNQYSTNNNEMTSQREFANNIQISPLGKKSADNHINPFQQDQFMLLHKCHQQPSTDKKQIFIHKIQAQSIKKQSQSFKNIIKLKTQDIFDDFHTKYDITQVQQFIQQTQGQGGSGISRGLNFQFQQNTKLIQIQSKKDLIKIETINSTQQINPFNFISLSQTDQNMFSGQLQINIDHEHTQKKINLKLSNQSSIQQFSTDKQNNLKNSSNQFQDNVSFGPTNNNINKPKKYRASNCRHFITKDFQNNSSLLQKNKPIIQLKRRVPFKNIQNLIQRNSKDQARSQTRKKQIINTDLLISTINRTQKHQVKQTNRARSNPINNKKSSSLQCTFTYDNMFKTNAFRETLKSTTLQNWKKKYHKKAENLGEKKTVSKKNRDINIFENLFIRA